MQINSERDKWLSQSDNQLLKDCIFSAQRRSGKGGQKINKTSSAIRLTHLPSGISVIASESRYQAENRLIALRKLRKKISLDCRAEVKKINLTEGIPSLKNPIYYQWVAYILDLLEKNSYSVSTAADELETSTNQLIKILSRDPELWQKVNEERKKRSLSPLNPK